jgi:SAM domain (Sterile alpha motif)
MAQLREWLEARGLGRYADALLAQDIELDILPQLTDADLTAAGLPVGARKRLLKAIEGQRNLSDAAMQSMGSPPIVPTTEPATERNDGRECASSEPANHRRRTHEYPKQFAQRPDGFRCGALG